MGYHRLVLLGSATRERVSGRMCASDRQEVEQRNAAFRLRDALTLRHVTGQKKGLDQLALATAGHAGESLVPLTVRYQRLRVEPLREQFKLCRRNLPAVDAIQ